MNFKGKHILSAEQFSKEDIEHVLREAAQMEPYAKKEKLSEIMKGKILATLFFEPSTRTRFSFEAAMLRLGGKVISNAMMNETSSIKKRETLYDTGKVVSAYVDVIAMRHPVAGTVAELAKGANVPVINAGDGPADHPTQGLMDVYTIWKKFKRLDGLTFGMVGDMKFSRVVHAECELLKNFGQSRFIFVSPKKLNFPEGLLRSLKEAGHAIEQTEDLESVIDELDVLSNTRIQEERFASLREYEKFRGAYSISTKLLRRAKSEMIIIDPLPRVDNQLKVEVDDDERAKYFEQITNGVAVRMALLKLVLE
ncbi:MAG: aspartate carbamoyltransferase, aspartate carbamoyltransferase catalytic subunit [Candidatus Peregrinibacteria bacterium GW2011_GWE2_39_6]|nr:MAG: aspartate carbamoyltransferase, aspartate carbamoyltransferase catalytic subunit [Candidatus Peregrinibacteria bacterium GW2011_GWF2_39_17]KKR26298.1 MAG: aspartate carbamoyltransferase, aspartate carbamoyltransferase catalytic subunit [Candidatus Peregrinibacteria bacterium GW2011_GWE2_39_6]HCW32681.1 aspartate carbamoyltransferase [Candidatus Peregrinibacteria bacterium]